MQNKDILSTVSAVSLLANAAVLALGVRALSVRGGITHLKSHWDGTPLASSDSIGRLGTVLTTHTSSIFLMVGINDAVKGMSVESAAENYRQTILHIRASSPNTIIFAKGAVGISPNGEPAGWPVGD